MKRMLMRIFVIILMLGLLVQPGLIARANALDQSDSLSDRSVQYVAVKKIRLLDEGNSAGAFVTYMYAGDRATLLSGTWSPTSYDWIEVQYGSYSGYTQALNLCIANRCYKVNSPAGLNLRTSPTNTAPVAAGLSNNTYLYLISIVDSNWYYVRVMSGTYVGLTGYVSSAYVVAG